MAAGAAAGAGRRGLTRAAIRVSPPRSRVYGQRVGPGKRADLPLRIAVLGNSMAIATRPWGHGGHQTSYPRQLEQVLAERGIETYLVNFGRQATMIDDAVRRWEDTVHAFSPDVVVVHFGSFECIPKAVPRRLESYVNGWNYHGGRLARRGRAVVVKAWPLARRWQRLVDTTLGLYRMRPEQYAWELRHFISLTRGVGTPLVLVPDSHQMGGRYTFWIPRINGRLTRMAATIRDVVAEFDDDVRLVDMNAIVDAAGGPEVLPDGVHFHAGLNRRLAEVLADEIEKW